MSAACRHSLPSFAAMAAAALVLLVRSAYGISGADETISSKESSPDPTAAQLEFFETKIRPVLVEHCYQCHGAAAAAKDQLKGGLLVDSKHGLLIGGDSGPALVPGQTDESVLLDALRYESFEMPPDGKLPDAVIADFETWIAAGAADPRTESTSATTSRVIDITAARNHWAYRPLPSSASDSETPVRVAIDRFVSDTLATEKLTANPPADRRTLIRRLYFDLHGLPPAPAEVDAFLNDTSSGAYTQLVDRLLASPEFGQHWGRHWLDIVRFAESVTLRGLVQHQAWRYRDYVIESFNADLPYDQFLREQIAGDLIPATDVADSQRQHIATTFLTMTNANLEDQDKENLRIDVVDEQLDVIGKAFLAQTLGCARCHDHKFDPIPTRDYYAMAGILQNSRSLETANVSSWLDLPLPLEPDQEARFTAFEARRKAVTSEIAALKKAGSKTGSQAVARNIKSLARKNLAGIVIDDEKAIFEGAWTRSAFQPIFVDAGYQHDGGELQGQKSATFSVQVKVTADHEVRMSYTAGANRSSRVKVTVRHADGEAVVLVNQQDEPPIEGLFVSLGTFPFLAAEPGEIIVSNEDSDGHVIVDCVQLLSAADVSPVAAPESATANPNEKPADAQKQMAALEDELKLLDKSLAARPRYMGVVPREPVTDMPIHIRGNVHQHGPIVPRGFLQIVSYNDPLAISDSESGRLQLASWITDSANPLPARVIANRTWHWLFGSGLVRTTDNFGFSGESPSHPQLLDLLAVRLVQQKWSLKSLIREIVLSDTYQRSSADNPTAMAVDPANRLLWRMNRRRLDAECIQDSILMATGALDRTHGGSALPEKLVADYDFEYQSSRRAIYWPQLRNSIPELLATFDGADPSLVVGSRNVSNVATQALFMMNSPWVMEQSDVAARDLIGRHESDFATLRSAFERILGRPPTTHESQVCLEYLTSPEATTESSRHSRWATLIQSLFSTVDFLHRY